MCVCDSGPRLGLYTVQMSVQLKSPWLVKTEGLNNLLRRAGLNEPISLELERLEVEAL